VRLRLNVWHRLALVLVTVAVAIGSLIWMSRHDPDINFLPGARGASWIVFPRPAHSASHKIINLDTAFRREFSVTTPPGKAVLRVRAARHLTVNINHTAVPLPAIRNWKEETVVEVGPLLRIGTNLLEARVFNDNAPAAFWLNLSGHVTNVSTDTSWESSITGSAWWPAALASRPRLPGPGNPMAGGENLRQALRESWPIELMLITAAFLLCAAAFRRAPQLVEKDADLPAIPLLGLAAALWLGLFIHNAILLPFPVGFDSSDHLDYIKYIQEQRRLPWPSDGYEMFQAPLFYLLSAVALALCHLSTSDLPGILLLRGLTSLLGVAQFVFVFLSVRLLFPRRPGLQLVALVLAAFLPMQLYLSHYVTNETLAATLGSGALYLALRLARTSKAPPYEFVLFGLILGAALLTKATTWLLVPPLFLMLAARLWREPALASNSLRNGSIAAAVTLAACGWYYVRIWTRFGTPLLGNWDVASGFSWWQDPGYHVAADYARFGRSLVAPFFGSLNGVWDGIYSTFWGDGLAGGAAQLAFRTPWNDAFLVCGYLWAILPTVMIACGAVATLWRFVRAPSLEYFLLLSSVAAIAFGVIFMTLKVACFGQVKAFYGLSAIVPICVFGAIGWEVMTRRLVRLQFVLAVLLLVFAMNSFAAVWIRRSPAQHMFAARRLDASHQIDAALIEAKKAVDSDPSGTAARILLSSLLEETAHFEGAIEEATHAVELDPLNSGTHLRLGFARAARGETETALAEARRAVELGPEAPAAYDLLLLCLTRSNRTEEIGPVVREALALSPFSALLHSTLGLATARQGDYGSALVQFGYAILIDPNWSEPRAKLRLVLSALSGDPEASKHLEELAALAHDSPALLNDVAWLRATSLEPSLRNGLEAVAMAERACGLTKRKDAACLATLAASYAETDRFTEAVGAAEEALRLARARNDVMLVTRLQKLLTEFQNNHPYREKSFSES
jgi:tetratricopeptide (TPR) repeat protein